MRKNKLAALLITSLFTLTLVTSCNSSSNTPSVETRNVFTLNESLKQLAYGESFKLSASFPSGNIEKVKWTSTNNGVVEVNENGFVTAKSIGKAVVVAETEDYSVSCKFVVSFGEYLPELIINNTYNDEIVISKGSDFIINAKVNYNHNSYDTSFDVYDYDESIISYEAGTITAKKVGTTEMLICGNWNNAPTDLINKKIKVKVVDNISFYCEVTVGGQKKITNSIDLSSVDFWCDKSYVTNAVLEPIIYVNGVYHLADFAVEDNGVVKKVGNQIYAANPGTNVIDLYYEDPDSGITYSTNILINVTCPLETYQGETVRFSAEEQFPVKNYFGADAKILTATQNGKSLKVHNNYIDGLDQLGPDSAPIQIITDKGGYYFPNVFVYTRMINKDNFVKTFSLKSGDILSGYYILSEDIPDEMDFTNQIASNNSTYFNGVFDGQNHTVNVKVDSNGVFGGFGAGAVVKDCKFNLTFNLASNKSTYGGLANNASTFINNEWQVKFENLCIITANFNANSHALCVYRPNNLVMNNTYIEINGAGALDPFTDVEQNYAALFQYDVTPLTGPSNQFFGDMRNNYVVTYQFMPLANSQFDGMKGRYVSYGRNDEITIKAGNEISIVHSDDRPAQSRYRIIYPSDKATQAQRKYFGFINVPELVTTGVIPNLETPMAALYGSSYSDGGIFRYNSKSQLGVSTVGTWKI